MIMQTGAVTAEQLAEAERKAEKASHGKKVWIFVTVVTLAISMGLNVAHPFVYHPEPDPDVVVILNQFGLVLMGLLSGLLPVVMMATMSHAIFAEAPWLVKLIVVGIFLIGMGMSLTAQYEMFVPAVGHVRALGSVAVIDIPALTALGMIERANRLWKAVVRLKAERERAVRERAERERRERLERERQAARQAEEDKRLEAKRAANERLAIEQKEAAQAVERAAEAKRQAAEQAAETERLAAERAEAERLAAEQRAAAERAEAERKEAERQAAAESAEAERARAARMREQAWAEAERRESERQEAELRAAAERAEAERKEAERSERAARAAERKAAAELAERGDIPAAEKRQIICDLYLENPEVKAPEAMAAVLARGGQISDVRARAILAEIRKEGSGLAEVRHLRQSAAV